MYEHQGELHEATGGPLTLGVSVVLAVSCPVSLFMEQPYAGPIARIAPST